MFTFNIYFQVMDINPSYNCLLGRPWMHIARAISLTLHRKVKFVMEEQLINMAAEEDVITTLIISNPYIKIDENAVKCSFQSIEVVNMTFVRERLKIPTPCLSRITRMRVKQTIRKGVKAGLGLGKYLQGTSKAMSIMMK
ncbi:hypothetical protein CRYUN_Cryun37aG0015900 [Craigia yunnanensis]